jgi:hypothetical protein
MIMVTLRQSNKVPERQFYMSAYRKKLPNADVGGSVAVGAYRT